MTEISDLPNGEMEVMEIVWQKMEVSVRDVFTELNKKRKLAYKTVGTLLGRLRERGYVEAEERNFAYVFRPLVSRDQVVRRKVDDLVNIVLGGDLTPLALYMAEHGDELTSEQIDALEAVVKAAKEKGER
ncbi:MAG: BlaI/MecI/CopY family transcriptional regulator [Armatimonadetes bacterium]|nr:BlaI/MecI/CopY family transcriptional regulator [Armatimonadota bacterium]